LFAKYTTWGICHEKLSNNKRNDNQAYSRVAGEREQLVMLQAHVDDSGSEPGSSVFVLAGYVLPAAAWADFSDHWIEELRRDRPISHLHMSETGQHTKGDFLGWKVDEIEQKLLSLALLISSYHPIALICHARWDEFSKFTSGSSNASLIGNPYKVLFYEIIRMMFGCGVINNEPQSVDFVFDGHGPVGAEAVDWYYDTKRSFPPEARPCFGSAPVFRDDKLVVPLQAADMLAWYWRRAVTKPVRRSTQEEISELLLKDGTTSELDAASFEKAAETFAALERNRRRSIERGEKGSGDRTLVV
jgi:Protein of unknown function (DUF3800)